VCILDESTLTGGVGASISALISETCYFELDMPVRRLCMDDAPVPYGEHPNLISLTLPSLTRRPIVARAP
jgi:pyruvate/2-oxoglutarate/acetoin dehydrogenase E1 component